MARTRAERAAAGALAGVAGLAIAAACGPLDVPPRATPPANACPDVDCRAYVDQAPLPTCETGACEVKQQLDYVLVVSVPLTSLFAPGHAVAMRSADFFARPTPKCRPRSCVVLPALASVDGDYLVNPEGARLVGHPLGNASGFTSIPVRVRMRPLWVPPAGVAATDALAAGLPLDELVGTARIATYPAAPPAPGGAPSVEYRVSVPAGPYARWIAPLEPFEASFPPQLAEVAAPTARYDELRLATDTTTVDTFVFPISRDGGSLEGFTAELVDVSSGERVSTLARLHAGSREAILRVLREDPPRTRRLDLRVTPPPAAREAEALPELRYDFVAGTTPPIRYPALPAPVIVEGNVGGRAREEDPAEFVAADLELASEEIEVAPATTERLRLAFVRRTATDASGAYSVRLPPGRYTLAVWPRAAGRWAKAPAQEVRVASAPAVQRGRLVALRPVAVARGRARLSDGRALAGAVIEARAAAVLSQPTEGGPAPSRATWPRPARAETDAAGFFELALDPGRYDVTVKPAPGTRFPWLVITSRYVGVESVDFGTLVVPAPINAGLRVHDANDNPILGALVRAYAAPREGTVAVEIGEATTDAEGRFDMDLGGYPK